MRAQFDPDVWAALLMILAVGFGGIIFVNLFISGLNMHAIMQVLDQQMSLKSIYIFSALASNDYLVSYQNGESSNMSSLENYYVVGKIQKENRYEKFVSEMNKSLYTHPAEIGGEKVNGVCGFISSQEDFINKLNECKSEGKIIASYQTDIYGPAGSGIIYLAFLQVRS